MAKIKELYDFSIFKNLLIALSLFFIASLPIIVDLPILYIGIVFTGLIFFYLIINQFKLYDFHLFIALILLAILFPSLEISPSLPRIRIEEILFYTFFPVLIISRISSIKLGENGLHFIRIYLIFLGLTIVSTIYGKIFLQVPVGFRDIVEIVTLGKYLIAFIGIYLMNFSDSEIRKILWIVLLAIFFSGVFGLLQFFGVFGIDAYTAPIYLLERAYIVSQRLTGTFKNPNSYSVILVIGHLITITLLFFEKGKIQKLALGLLALFFLMCLLFTGSRTMIAAYGLVTIILFVILFSNKNLNFFSILLIVFFLSITFLIGFSVLTDDILLRLQSGVDVLGDESFGMRIIIWFLNLKLFLASPIFGWGPAKDFFTTVVDNEFILVLRRYGVLGFLCYLMIYLFPLYKSFKSLNHRNEKHKALSIIFFTILLILLITCLTNNILHNIQTMDFWIIMLALFFTSLDRNKSIQNDKKKS